MKLDFLRRTQTQPAPQAKASAAGPVVAWHNAGRVAWTPRDNASLTRSGFAGNPVGFRAVKLIAEAAAALPVVLQDAKRRYAHHPVLALLARPNAGQGRNAFLEALFGQVLLSGRCCVRWWSDNGQPSSRAARYARIQNAGLPP